MTIETFYADKLTRFPYPRQPAVQPSLISSNGSAPKTNGIDVSRWQGANINYQQCFDEGVKFAYVRCTVGDYYTDLYFEQNWQGFGSAGILRAPYLVVAPAWSPEYGYHPLTVEDHWQRFTTAFGERVPDLPLVLDCELDRGMSPEYIANLIDGLIWRIQEHYDRLPIIYTRGNWWNANTVSKTSFGLCDLWIARYNTSLETPWSDNEQYQPRDWDTWTFWQYSEEGTLSGIPDSHVDLNWFNGTLEDLLQYADGDYVEPPPPPDPEPEILYRVRIKPHLSFWNIRAHPANPAWMAPDMGDAKGGLELCVLEEKELEGYTWLRCGGDNFWIRSDGTERV